MTSMLPIFLIAASSGGNKKEMATTVLFASNMLPEAPRTILAFSAAQEREREQRRTAEDLASAMIEKQFRFGEQELSQHPHLEKLLNLLSPELRDQVVEGSN